MKSTQDLVSRQHILSSPVATGDDAEFCELVALEPRAEVEAQARRVHDAADDLFQDFLEGGDIDEVVEKLDKFLLALDVAVYAEVLTMRRRTAGRPVVGTPRQRPRCSRRRTHRQQEKGEDAGDGDPDPDPPVYPPLDAWSSDSLGDLEQWESGEYATQAHALDSLHQTTRPGSPAPLPEIENRPPQDVIELWSHAKAQATALADQFRALPSGYASAVALKMGSCQSHFWIAPNDEGWAITNVRRCFYRLCPVDSLARARRLRPQIDAIAPRLQDTGKLSFCTVKASDQPPGRSFTYCENPVPPPKSAIAGLWSAWSKMTNRKPYRRAVDGAFCGLHISQGLRPHLHAVLVGNALVDPLDLARWWQSAANAAGMSNPTAFVEEVRSPQQAMQYIARPCNPRLIDDPQRLPELFSLVKGIQTIRRTGLVAELWPTEQPCGELTGPALRYGWTWNDNPAKGEYDLTP